MSPLQIKNNPKGKKEIQTHKVSEAGNWEKNTNKKNRNIEKERVTETSRWRSDLVSGKLFCAQEGKKLCFAENLTN